MATLFDIVEGWTGVLGPFILKVNGVVYDLTSHQVNIKLRNVAGAVTPQGTVTVHPDQIVHRGEVMYAPHADDFVWVPSGPSNRQTYTIHWEVIDQALKKVAFPNGEPDEIGVYRS
jgi:hypothetical protein